MSDLTAAYMSGYHDCEVKQRENITELNEDLATAESAVADLMELNDKLTAERDRLFSASYDVVKMWERLWRKTGLKKNETMNRKETVLYDAVKALDHKEG